MLKDVGHLSTCEGSHNSPLVFVGIVKLDYEARQLRGIGEDHVANGHGHKQPEGWQVEMTLVPGGVPELARVAGHHRSLGLSNHRRAS
jgi:hypothetical protein